MSSSSSSAAARCDVHVSYRMMLVQAAGGLTDVDPPEHAPNALVAARPELVTIWTGTHTGMVSVMVELATSAPAERAQGWDEVEEVEVATSTGLLQVMGFMDGPPEDMPILTPQGPGAYRLRVHARGRSADPPGTPGEEYLLIIWPVRTGQEAVDEFVAANPLPLTDREVALRAWRQAHGPTHERGRLPSGGPSADGDLPLKPVDMRRSE